MDFRDDPTDSSAADAAEPATSTGQSDEDADEIDGFIFNNSLESDGSSSEPETEQLAEREQKHIVDLVRLQPTKNAELQDQWGLASGSAIHQYLESQLKEYYYRDDDGYIRATDAAEKLAQHHQEMSQDITEPESNIDIEDSEPDLQRRDLVIALVTLIQDLGHLPSADEINEHGEYRHQRYREEFGDLFNAYQAAGILPDNVTRQDFYGEADLESKTEDEAKTEGRSEALSEPEQEEKIPEPEESGEVAPDSEPVEIDVTKVDIDRPTFQGPENFDRADLIGEIQQFADIIEEPPTERLVKAYGRYPFDEYRKMFESWDVALDAAGLDPDDMPDWSGRSHTNVEILDQLRAVADELGHPPNLKEVGGHANFLPGLPSVRFGSLSDALEIAGLDPSKRPSVQNKEPADSTDNKEVNDNTTIDDDNKNGEDKSEIQDSENEDHSARKQAIVKKRNMAERQRTTARIWSLLEEVETACTDVETTADADQIESATATLEAAEETLARADQLADGCEINQPELIERLYRLEARLDAALPEWRVSYLRSVRTAQAHAETAQRAASVNETQSAIESYEEAIESYTDAIETTQNVESGTNHLSTTDIDELKSCRKELRVKKAELLDEATLNDITAPDKDIPDASPTYDKVDKEIQQVRNELTENFSSNDPSDNDESVQIRQKLLAELERIDDQTEGCPLTTELNNKSEFTPNQYYQEFGSWDKALEAAGIDKEKRLIKDIKNVAETVGERPTTTQVNQHGVHSSGIHTSHFDSWDAAIDAAGVSDTDTKDPDTTSVRVQTASQPAQNEGASDSPTQNEGRSLDEEPTPSELIEELQRLDDETDGYPLTTQVRRRGQYDPEQYYAKFGSWDDVLRAAGIDKAQRLLDEIERVAKIVGDRPTTPDMNEHGAVSATTHANHFGSWTNAVNAAEEKGQLMRIIDEPSTASPDESSSDTTGSSADAASEISTGEESTDLVESLMEDLQEDL